MELYDRQQDLGVRSDRSVMLVGCGGVGAWVGLFLALGGTKHLSLYDGDNVDLTNLNRMPYPAEEVGKNKAEALRDLIEKMRPKCQVTARPHFLPQIHEGRVGEVDCVVVATDNLQSRLDLKKLADKAAVSYIECGAEALQASVTNTPPEWSTPKEAQAGYEIVPSFVGPCVLAAAVTASHVLLDSGSYRNRAEFTYQMKWDVAKDLFDLKRIIEKGEG